jgi:NADP-dependent aldehyde dehydrogenase
MKAGLKRRPCFLTNHQENAMGLTGEMLIGASAVRGSEGAMRAFDPVQNKDIEPAFGLGGKAEVDRACELARLAFDAYRNAPLENRALFLEAIAQNILDLGDALIDRAHLETALPIARLQGERGRTVGQLRLFAQVVRDGHFLRAAIDPAQPDRKPMARVDLRLAKIPLGPVAVFGASNFPLAFSVAGGDTAAALAAGAPVVVKAHNAHLGTSELVGRAIQKAVADAGLPEGVFSMVIGAGNDIGAALVAHPAIKAVGFTGSRQGGLALVKAAAARREPIPVYAEMSSINPVFLFPAATAARGDAIGRGFADSLTMGSGQFCTNPGLVIGVAGAQLDAFIASATEALKLKPSTAMLTPGIFEAYQRGVAQLDGAAGVQKVAEGVAAGTQCNAARPALYVTDARNFLATDRLEQEVFGPSSLVVKVKDFDELLQVAEHIEGQLTVTLQIDEADHDQARRLLPTLERKAGRILVNGFPTGVEVSHAMVHGGPFPSTSNAAFTSVGSTSIDRFLRPVSYQDMPADLLPLSLRDGNPLDLWRVIDGKLQQG